MSENNNNNRSNSFLGLAGKVAGAGRTLKNAMTESTRLNELSSDDGEGVLLNDNNDSSSSVYVLNGSKITITNLESLYLNGITFKMMIVTPPSRGLLRKVLGMQKKEEINKHLEGVLLPELVALATKSLIYRDGNLLMTSQEANTQKSLGLRLGYYVLFRIFLSHSSALDLADELSSLRPVNRLRVVNALSQQMGGVNDDELEAYLIQNHIMDDDDTELAAPGPIIKKVVAEIGVRYPGQAYRIKQAFATVQTVS
jgi:hypothetical protein